MGGSVYAVRLVRFLYHLCKSKNEETDTRNSLSSNNRDRSTPRKRGPPVAALGILGALEPRKVAHSDSVSDVRRRSDENLHSEYSFREEPREERKEKKGFWGLGKDKRKEHERDGHSRPKEHSPIWNPQPEKDQVATEQEIELEQERERERDREWEREMERERAHHLAPVPARLTEEPVLQETRFNDEDGRADLMRMIGACNNYHSPRLNTYVLNRLPYRDSI